LEFLRTDPDIIFTAFFLQPGSSASKLEGFYHKIERRIKRIKENPKNIKISLVYVKNITYFGHSQMV